MLFHNRLTAITRINAARAKKKHTFYSGLVSRIDYVDLNHEILVNKIGTISIVGVNPSGFGRRQKNEIRPFFQEKIGSFRLIEQIQFSMSPCDQIRIA